MERSDSRLASAAMRRLRRRSRPCKRCAASIRRRDSSDSLLVLVPHGTKTFKSIRSRHRDLQKSRRYGQSCLRKPKGKTYDKDIRHSPSHPLAKQIAASTASSDDGRLYITTY